MMMVWMIGRVIRITWRIFATFVETVRMVWITWTIWITICRITSSIGPHRQAAVYPRLQALSRVDIDLIRGSAAAEPGVRRCDTVVARANPAGRIQTMTATPASNQSTAWMFLDDIANRIATISSGVTIRYDDHNGRWAATSDIQIATAGTSTCTYPNGYDSTPEGAVRHLFDQLCAVQHPNHLVNHTVPGREQWNWAGDRFNLAPLAWTT